VVAGVGAMSAAAWHRDCNALVTLAKLIVCGWTRYLLPNRAMNFVKWSFGVTERVLPIYQPPGDDRTCCLTLTLNDRRMIGAMLRTLFCAQYGGGERTS
jgi:hypothetical protein